MRRIITIMLAAAMALSTLQVSAAEEAPAGHAIEKKTFPHLYCFHEKSEPKAGEINLYFIDGGDVPYVALSEFLPVLTEMYNVSLECGEDQQVSFETQTADQPDGGVFIVRRPDNGSTWIIQPGDDTMTFTNYNSFGHKPGASALVSVTELPDIRQTIDPTEFALELMYANRNGEDTKELQMKALNFGKVEEDPAAEHSLYCLISPSSFSCGNLVPAIFDQAGGITLIGQRSGGGSNVVLPGTTASGMIFQMSGPLQITTYNNGSLYGVDTGVEPQVRLNKTESFYDREALVEMIHGLK